MQGAQFSRTLSRMSFLADSIVNRTILEHSYLFMWKWCFLDFCSLKGAFIQSTLFINGISFPFFTFLLKEMPFFLEEYHLFQDHRKWHLLEYFFRRRIIIFVFWRNSNFLFRGKIFHLYPTCRKYHISMQFLRKIIFHFMCKKESSIFEKKNPSFVVLQKIPYYSTFFGNTIFLKHLGKNVGFGAVKA